MSDTVESAWNMVGVLAIVNLGGDKHIFGEGRNGEV